MQQMLPLQSQTAAKQLKTQDFFKFKNEIEIGARIA